MIDVDSDALVRTAALFELVVLTFCGTYLHTTYRAGLPRELKIVGRCFSGVLAAFAAGIILNLGSGRPATPGLHLVVVVCAPIATLLARAAARDIRARRR